MKFNFSKYLELGQFREAEEAFRNATLLQPTHVLAWTNLIVMLDNTGKPLIINKF